MSRLLITVIRIIAPYRFIGLTVGIVLVAFCQVDAATITAKSVSIADVSSAIASARDGDTVAVPAGTASWTSGLAITKGITLQGAGNDKTVILDDLPRKKRGELPLRRRSPERPKQEVPKEPRDASSAQAMIEEHGELAPRRRKREGPKKERPGRPRDASAGRVAAHGRTRPNGGPPRGLMDIKLTPSQSFRLTGFTFRNGSVATKAPGGVIRVIGTCPSVRIDHCHFDQLTQIGIWFSGWIYGVVDHCRWDVRANAGSIQAMSVNNGAAWGGRSNQNGDGSWSAPTDFGSEKFVFVENCMFNNLGTSPSAGKIDGQYGGRFVSRFNQYINTSVISGHGTESGGRHRGIRAAEFYYNTRTGTVNSGWGETRSGTRMYHHNTWTGPGGRGMPLNVHREFWAFKGFGGATGNNPWDMNDTEGNGRWVEGRAPHLYASGTAASNSTIAGDNGILTASGSPGWQNDALKDMMLINESQLGKNGGVPCRIVSNTSNTITFSSDDGGYSRNNSGLKQFTAGEKFVVYRVLVALDQVGRGQGDLLAGNPPINTVTGTKAWPHQALEPIYAFENRTNGTLTPVASSYPTVQENRDYYNQTASSDGTVGVGVGTLANRPKTCTPGVAYWATDQGEWNSTHDGPDGQLYVCTAPNTWSLHYRPHTYPHPLVSGVPAAPGKTAEDQQRTTDVSSSSSN
jgi:hypothetical protein